MRCNWCTFRRQFSYQNHQCGSQCISDQICQKWIRLDPIWVFHLSKNVTIKSCHIYHENRQGWLKNHVPILSIFFSLHVSAEKTELIHTSFWGRGTGPLAAAAAAIARTSWLWCKAILTSLLGSLLGPEEIEDTEAVDFRNWLW